MENVYGYAKLRYTLLYGQGSLVEYDKKFTFTKLKIAKYQLEKAIQLFLEESDFVCSVTLAGASEEILGKLLETKGETPELKECAKQCEEDAEDIIDANYKEKDFVSISNYFRNGFKHYNEGESIVFSGWAPVEMLNRAITNYFRLTGSETELMKKFNWEVNGV